MNPFLNLTEGAVVKSGGKLYAITHLLDLETVLAKEVETGKSEQLHIKDITSVADLTGADTEEQVEVSIIDRDVWDQAERWYERIRPLLSVSRRTVEMIEEVARDAGVNIVTVYRKIQLYEQTGRISSLASSKSTGGRGKSRLSDTAEDILIKTIDEFYFNKQKQKRSIKKTHQEAERRFRNARLKPPNVKTVSKRIKAISQKKKDEHHLGIQEARKKNSAFPEHFPDANFPLSVVQIDHTKLDIIVVDDVHHLAIGRPWITLAIDVFSRMVVGLFISLDPPNTMSVGLCLVHAILMKDKWLAGYGIDIPWPCWGIMRKIHADNAGEFRGEMLRRACKEYTMDLEWRPVKQPHYGGHIERLLGTFLTEIHDLPGTTFSNPEERGQYDSEKYAGITRSQLEKWLATFISGVYHQRVHSALDTSPVKQYELGIFGNEEIPGRGLPVRVVDEDRLRLDLMPYVERTIQSYGIMIGKIRYFSNVLKRYVNAKDPQNPKLKRKFIFKRDPRDISLIYFYDPQLKQYFKVPYADTSHPAISIWDYRKARKRIKDQGLKDVDERLIFATYEKMLAQVKEAERETKSARLAEQRRRDNKQAAKPKTADETIPTATKDNQPVDPLPDITPFDDFED